MDKAASILPKVLGKRGLGPHAMSSFVVFKASEWLQERLPAMVGQFQVTMVKDGQLHVQCTHSIALQEIHALSYDLCQYLSVECPFMQLDSVRTVRQ